MSSQNSLIGSIRIDRPTPIVKADALVYILFNKENLQRQKEFLVDFGMTLASETADALYLRGVGSQPYFYVAYDLARQKQLQGKAVGKGFVGLGFSVPTETDLQKLSLATARPIEAVDGPGGGQRVRLRDPDDFVVDVVWGRQQVCRLESRETAIAANTPLSKQRVNDTVRVPVQPSAIERIGHCVLAVSHFETSVQWYLKHLGLIPTDVQCVEDGSPVLSFNRLDRGAEPADHHVLVLLQNTSAFYMHSAYETLDIDSVGQGQQYLLARGWKHQWGMGRHVLGSQIFDYWLDPEGDELEHYADGDVFDSSYPTGYHLLEPGSLYAWGDDVPNFAPKMNLRTILSVIKAFRSGKLSPQRLGLIKKAMSAKARPWL